MIRGRTLFVGLVLALGAGASAQFGMPQMPSLWYNPALLMIPSVQKELKVSPEVANKATQAMMSEAMKLGASMKGAMGGQGPSPAQMKEATAALARMQEESTKDLTPAQKVRLHEITLQSYGPKALLDPKVAAQVGLTSSQSESLRTVVTKSALAQRAAMQGGGKGFDMAGMQAAAKNGRKQTDAALDSILTSKQKAKWKALQGKPVDLGPLGAMMGG